jgi:hypothetical protein
LIGVRELVTDLNQFPIITDQLQQAHVNVHVMTRLMLSTIKGDPALAFGSHPIVDGSEVYYLGGSDGGIQGATFMAMTPDVVRGVLDVPGCEWTLMLQRSSDFYPFQALISTFYADPLDQLVILGLAQSEWDYTDPATFASHLLDHPLPGTVAKRIIVRESIGDSQVTNVATRVLARTIGLPGLDLEYPVFGIAEAPPPLQSAYTQWDFHPMMPPPAGNIPAHGQRRSHRDHGASGGHLPGTHAIAPSRSRHSGPAR